MMHPSSDWTRQRERDSMGLLAPSTGAVVLRVRVRRSNQGGAAAAARRREAARVQGPQGGRGPDARARTQQDRSPTCRAIL